MFEVLSFLVGVVTVVPQILLPLAADLAPPERRASAISIVLSGLLFGILIARVLAGVVAEFSSWRVIYYMSVGVQYFVLIGAYLIIPDFPAKNHELTYFNILTSMAKFAVTEPKLIQAAIITLASSACFSSFWVRCIPIVPKNDLTPFEGDFDFPSRRPTLSLLHVRHLSGFYLTSSYTLARLVIGLFGLVGMLGVAVGPLIGKLVDRLVPWYAALVATFLLLIFQAVQTGAGGINISAVILACFGLDVFRQMQQVSLTSSVFTLVQWICFGLIK